MKILSKILLVVVILGAGALYYAKRKNIDLKTLFSSSCDCHTGCDLKSKPATPPASTVTPEPAKTPAAPVSTVPPVPAHTTTPTTGTSTTVKLSPTVKPAATTAE